MILYHIYIDGQRITSDPLTLNLINRLYGSIQALEAQGFRLVKVPHAN